MKLSMEGNSGIFVELVPGQIEYEGPIDLSQYYIREKGIEKRKSQIEVKFTLGRRLLSSILTIYVPTLLLNIIGLATNYFKVRYLQFKIFQTLNYYFIFSDFITRTFSLKQLSQ